MEWIGQRDFEDDLYWMLLPADVDLSSGYHLMPQPPANVVEAKLDMHGGRLLPGHDDIWPQLADWWLAHKRGANTPNWDMAIGCEIEGRPGLVLVEAKANVPELKSEGKALSTSASANGVANHERIRAAIHEARSGWQQLDPGVRISIDSHYQLANRLAFTWKLATLGIPVVLLYLGFTGDRGITHVGEPFRDDAHWQQAFRDHFADVASLSLLERRLEISDMPVWLVSRSRPALNPSPLLTDARDVTPEFVKVQPSEHALSILVGRIEWDGPAHPYREWDVFAELPLDADAGEIERAVGEAHRSKEYFGTCEWCGVKQPVGWMHNAHFCRGCAQDFGVVY